MCWLKLQSWVPNPRMVTCAEPGVQTPLDASVLPAAPVPEVAALVADGSVMKSAAGYNSAS